MVDADKADILIVDDTPEKLLVLGSVLEQLGENLVTADSGAEALRQVLDREFAVILLDVNMPGMDGFETATLIRRRKKSAHTPIIFITAFADELHASRGYSLGAVDFILAPVIPDVLRTKVQVFVDLFRMTQQVRRQADERIALARAESARAAAEDATRRSTFLAEASKVLGSSLDPEATVQRLLQLATPVLSDVSAVMSTSELGQPAATEAAWVAATGERQQRRLAGPEVIHVELAEPMRRVLRTGQPELLSNLAEHATASSNGIPLPAVKRALLLPLGARGKRFGVLGLAVGSSRRLFGEADSALAQELADRAAVALDNALLYREVQEADRRKNEFLAMLAHELRNPLAPIRNAVALMGITPVPGPVLAQARAMIERQVQQLVRLVDDLLDISRITRGKIRLQLENVEPAEVMRRAVETIRPLVEARRHELTINLPAESVCLRADPVRLAQVLANLLNNAVKYTEPGGHIWLTGAVEGRSLEFRIRDTGIGIPKDLLASVFDPFTQADRSLDRSQGGLGIGLTLARQLVELHGGTVQAHSEGPGEGSEFVVRLPLSSPGACAPGDAGDPPPLATSPMPRRVLLVDDNRDAADSLAVLLRLAGHEVHVANDAHEALAAAQTLVPDAVLLDIGLPGLDGYELARRMRRILAGRQPLLVAVTGYGREDDRRRSEAAGFDAHLIKPADLAVLERLLQKAGTPAATPG